MRRILIGLLSAAFAAPVFAYSDDADDWRVFARVLALVQPIVRAAAVSPNPDVAQREMDSIIQGRSPEANRLASDLFEEILQDLPREHRGTFVSIGRDLLTIARREQARAALRPEPVLAERAIQARKDLHAMGLRYYDETQYLDAVRRGDLIAIELYHAGGGLRSLQPAR